MEWRGLDLDKWIYLIYAFIALNLNPQPIQIMVSSVFDNNLEITNILVNILTYLSEYYKRSDNNSHQIKNAERIGNYWLQHWDL